MSTAPGRASRDHRALTGHEARAWLVDYIAACHRDAATEPSPDIASTLTEVANDLSTMLRRWDVTSDSDHRPP